MTSDPPNIQGPPWDTCGQPNAGDEGPLVAEALCATQLLFDCPSNPAANYPRPTKVQLMPIPHEPTMANPCVHVPANPWCPNGVSLGSNAVRHAHTAPAGPARREEWLVPVWTAAGGPTPSTEAGRRHHHRPQRDRPARGRPGERLPERGGRFRGRHPERLRGHEHGRRGHHAQLLRTG